MNRTRNISRHEKSSIGNPDGQDSTGSVWEPVAGSSEHGNELLRFLKVRKLL
jgi:hypothetical protein